jgi:hypothetical protein
MSEIVTIYKTDDKIREAAHWHKLKSNQKKNRKSSSWLYSQQNLLDSFWSYEGW